MRDLSPRRAGLRRAASLGAASLLLPVVAVTASASAGSTAAPAALTASAAPVQLPTSWPAVPVGERLQPWLAGELAKGGDAPLRVMVSGESTAVASAAVQAVGLTAQQTWDKVGIVVGVGTPAQVSAVVGQPGVTYVEGDMPLEYTLDTAHEATRSNQALGTYKAPDGGRIDGSGVTVAVIDSGIDGTHPFFTDADGVSKVVQNRKNACGITLVPSTNEACFQQPPVNDTDTESLGGHGTHVAGIVAGNEVVTSSPEGTKLRGSAPGAKLVGLSVGAALGLLDANAAMTWVVDHQRNPCKSAAEQDAELDPACPPIRATNHSYGPATAPEEGFTFNESSATVRIQRTLVTQGVTPVWAAGNSAGDGSIAQTNPPGMDPTPGVLMVASYNDGGAGNRDNQLSGFSSRGKDGDTTTYPDVSAPGDAITSSCRPTLSICTGDPSFDNGNYQTISGTSMATPYTAGVVAQLAQANPRITPGEGENLIEDTAHKFTAGAPYEADPDRNDDDETSFDKGHGLLDVAALQAAQQGLDSPDEPAPLCTDSSPQVVDPEGDATQFVIVDTPAPSQADVDILEGRLTYDSAKDELTFRITVSDLAGADGDEYFRFYVTRESDAEVFAIANRDATGESFLLKQQDSGKTTPLTGTFDEETNEVTVVLPAAQYGDVIPEQTIAEGDLIGVGQILGQRDTGVITATADSAAGSCPFTVGGSSGGGTEPEPAPTTSEDPNVDPSPSGEPQPSEAPTPEPSESASPEPSESASPEPSESASPEPSESASPEPNEPQQTAGARTVEDACPEGEGGVPSNSRGDDDGNPHEAAIDCVVWWNIARGTSATEYKPSQDVTRAQAATFIAQLIERTGGSLANPRRDYFDDDQGLEHERNINTLAEAGLVMGTSPGKYSPNGIVQRDQLATLLVNAYERVSPNALSSERDYFGDDTGNRHENNINKAASVGFTDGRGAGYEPSTLVKRDATASFLARVLDLLVQEGTTPPHE